MLCLLLPCLKKSKSIYVKLMKRVFIYLYALTLKVQIFLTMLNNWTGISNN